LARKGRIQYPGAVCHVMNRGDRREVIFADDQDRRCFLETLEEALQKTGWRGSSSSTSAPVPSWRPGSHTGKYDNLINRPLYFMTLTDPCYGIG